MSAPDQRPVQEVFRQFARAAADAVGSPAAFLLGLVVILAWGLTGPYFYYSDTWQLVVNTGTSIATFLIVFLIQNTQNRDAKVMQLKLDELIRAVTQARTELVQMEGLTDQQLADLKQEFERVRDRAAGNLQALEARRQCRGEKPAQEQTLLPASPPAARPPAQTARPPASPPATRPPAQRSA